MTNNIVVLDLETAKSADDCIRCGMAEEQHGLHNVCETPDLRVVGARFSSIGWNNKSLLGISIGCWWSYADSRMHWFDTHTLGETVQHFVETQPLLVSFNGIAFDFPLMRGLLRQQADVLRHTGDQGDQPQCKELVQCCDAFKALCATSYDILAEIWKADPARKFEPGLNSLDAISQANGLGAKLSHGAQAPRDWREGNHARVLNYCMDDVYKTKALFERICAGQPILRGDGQPITLRRPEGLEVSHASHS